MSGIYTNELQQFQEKFDAVEVPPAKEPLEAEKKQWVPPFTPGERENGIITDAYLSRAPWDNDDGVYLRLNILHEEKDQSIDQYLPLSGKSEKQTQFVKKTLQTLGFDLDLPENTLAGLEDEAHKFEGLIVELYTSSYQKGNGKTGYNHYINKIVGAGTVNKDPNDDIPF
jgi:hypothetical protein